MDASVTKTDRDEETCKRNNEIIQNELRTATERKKCFQYKVDYPQEYIRYRKEKITKESEERKRNLRDKITEENENTDKAMTSLSQIASSKLRDNNPNVLDLSDENRPSKIAEKLSELYDNEWTDAYNVVEATTTETQCIAILLGVLKDAYRECEGLANENYFRRIQCCIESPIKCASANNEPIVMPDLLKQQIKEFRKRRAVQTMKHIQKVVVPLIHIQNADSPMIQTYVKSCVETCWFMVIQDPPLVFEYGSDDIFDKNKFREYTQRGMYVDYIVWPALLMHEGGAMLSKGIAQGCKVKKAPSDS